MIDSYSETRVVLAPSGEFLLALPIYANENGALFNSDEIRSFAGDSSLTSNLSIGIYQHMGFLLYHPEQSMSFYMKSLDLFEDLGKL